MVVSVKNYWFYFITSEMFMADILKYICNVSDVNCQYQDIHNKIFNLSIRKLVIDIFSEQSVSFKKYGDGLKMLHGQLINIQTVLNELPQSELKILKGKEILLALSDYIAALSKSINYLQEICNDKNNLSGSDDNLDNYKMVYDDAIQHHKHLGGRLNELLSSF